MNDAIIVNYDPFVMESKVSIIKDSHENQIKVCSKIEELSEALVGFSYGYNIYSIKVEGPFAILNEIRRNIDKCESSLYSQNKIIVEGI